MWRNDPQLTVQYVDHFRSPLQRRFPLTTRSASLIAYGIMDLWAGSGPAAFVTLGIPLFNFLLHSYTLLHRYARNVPLQLQTLMDFDRSLPSLAEERTTDGCSSFQTEQSLLRGLPSHLPHT
jgi:hypothetical protein